jgi:hypothetical protein
MSLNNRLTKLESLRSSEASTPAGMSWLEQRIAEAGLLPPRTPEEEARAQAFFEWLMKEEEEVQQ